MDDDSGKDNLRSKSFSIRLLCLGKDAAFLRTIGGILCIYFGISFSMIGIVLTFIFPQRSNRLLKVIDPMITEWWNSIGIYGEIFTLLWGIITTIIVYTHPNAMFSKISSKLIYGLGNVCAAKLGSELALMNIKRSKCPDIEKESDNHENDEILKESEGVTLLGATNV